MRDDLFGPWTVRRRVIWAVLAVLSCAAFGPTFVYSLRAMKLELKPGLAPAASGPDFLDFAQEYSSARNLLAGRPTYSPLSDTSLEYVGVPLDKNALQFNAHPPTSVLLAVPLAGLGYQDAFLAWDLATLAALLVSGWLIVRQLGVVLSPWSALPLVTLFLVGNVFRQQFNQGQLNGVLLLLLTGCWAADRSGRPWLAGALLGAAVAIKIFPALLFVYFAWRRRWGVVLGGAASAAALAGLTFAAFGARGFETYSDYYHLAMPAVQSYRDAWLNASLAGWWYKLFDGGGRQTATPLVAAPAVAAAGTLACDAVVLGVLLALTRRGGGRDENDLTFGLALNAMTLTSPITWDHYFLLLLLPAVLMWRRMRGSGWRALVLLLVLLPPMIDPNTFWRLTVPGPGESKGQVASYWQTLGVLSYLFYAQCALFALIAAEVWRARSDGARQFGREKAGGA
jgi:hypothetical protein